VLLFRRRRELFVQVAKVVFTPIDILVLHEAVLLLLELGHDLCLPLESLLLFQLLVLSWIRRSSLRSLIRQTLAAHPIRPVDGSFVSQISQYKLNFRLARLECLVRCDPAKQSRNSIAIADRMLRLLRQSQAAERVQPSIQRVILHHRTRLPRHGRVFARIL